ncbi:tyrosine-type recombinase/integrase [Cellulosilyticum sp. WCF-2]|uniref:tyrosine-type recombinase/integrase n=1 Tax=Cellulosilyticum sp. WCF-2 TaxID=2497860 RepID=UPI00168172C6|nr:tyrosine-type recombinase/integrase [Cellulosilyticum sp. WCF-2]
MRNYCDLVTLPKAEKKDDEVIKCFSETEQKTLIASLEGNRNKPLYLTALGCGLRLGEIIGLKWEDIDFKKETISIKRAVSNIAKVKSDGTREWGVIEHTPKTETSVRTIPIPKTLVNIRRNKVRNA